MNDQDKLNKITENIIFCAIKVHRTLGPGLLESAYETCLTYELLSLGLKVEVQKPLPLTYGEVKLSCAYRLDLLVENKVVVDIKSSACLLPIHEAQLLSYLKFSHYKVGLLINFNVKVLKTRIRRLIY